MQREFLQHTDPARENLFVVDIALHPTHHLLDVRRRRHLGRPLVVLAILPEVLEFVCRLHLWAGLWGAELGNGAIEEVDLVVKVHHYSTLDSLSFSQLSALEVPAPYCSQLAIHSHLRLRVA